METDVERYKNVCRICTFPTADMQDLFVTEMSGMVLSEMLAYCTNSDVNQMDGLPSLICSGCLVNLETTYDFLGLCRRSADEFRTALTCTRIDAKKDILSMETEMDNPRTSTRKLRSSDNSNSIQKEEQLISSTFSTSIQIEYMDESDIVLRLVESGDEIKDQNIKDIVVDTPDSGGDKPLSREKSKPKKEYKCDVCGRVFDKPYRLLRHSNVHNAEGKPFECTTCHRRFASESNLTRHAITHSELLNLSVETVGQSDRIFKCRECDREFTKQESLSAHMQTHTRKENPSKEFHCDYCSKAFPRLSKLTRHMRIHAEMKKFACSICGNTFATSGHLIDHLNKHNGIKPHECHVCHKGGWAHRLRCYFCRKFMQTILSNHI